MKNEFSRSQLLFGTNYLEKLNNKTVCIFGVGGVGGYVCEALARSGISNFVLVDHDTVSLTNINRQIIALHSTIDNSKVEVMKERILDINPNANVCIREEFFLPENQDTFDFSKYSYVVDCVDTVTAKIAIVMKSNEANVKVISAMGAGNKMDPTKLMVSDIYKTSVDPLARVMRIELKKRRVKKLKVVYSTETPITLDEIELKKAMEEEPTTKRSLPGSTAFVPSAMGLIIASEIIKDLLEGE